MYKVVLINLQTLGASCGYGEGKTLQEAQENALKLAKERDPKAYLSDSGYQVYFCGGINC